MKVVRASSLPPTVLRFAAEQLVAEFGHLYPEWDSEGAFLELSSDPGTGLPLNILMIENGLLLGVASVLSDDEVVGWEDKDWWLANVLVLPEHRGRGIGKALVSTALISAHAAGAADFHLVTDSAEDWYLAQGWQKVGTGLVHGNRLAVLKLSL